MKNLLNFTFFTVGHYFDYYFIEFYLYLNFQELIILNVKEYFLNDFFQAVSESTL